MLVQVLCILQGVFRFALGAPDAQAARAEAVQIQSFPSHATVSIGVDETVKTRLKVEKTKFTLVLEGIVLADLGSKDGLIRSSDVRIGSLELRDSEEGIAVTGAFKYPKGNEAPVEPAMQAFEYRQSSPPAYVIDFWPKKGITVGQARAEAIARKKKLQFQKSQKLAKRSKEIRAISRRPSGAEGFDFCEHPLSDKTDTFVHFVPFHQGFAFDRYLPFNRPDRDYPYLNIEAPGEEGDLARMMLELYQKGRPALASKTLEFFEQKYPQSKFLSELRFIRGNALYRLGQKEEALAAFKDLMTQDPHSPQALFGGIFLAAQALEKKDSLQQIEQFMWLSRNHPQHRLSWVFHMGMAEALAKLGEAERARKEYQWVIENAETAEQQSEAAYRIGDMYMYRNQYEDAVTAYFKALSLYPKRKVDFPSLYVNRAESYYWLGELDRSKAEFEAFLKDQANHPAGWRATFRLGEIADRKSKRGGKEAVADYLRTVNQFPHTAGATLARMRLLPCGDNGGFTLETADRFLKDDVERISQSPEIVQSDLVDFSAMTKALAYQSLGAPEQAVDVILGELKRKPGDSAAERLKLAFLISARLKILKLLEQDKSFEALSFYKNNEIYFPFSGPRAAEGAPAVSKYEPQLEDYDFLLKLSQAAADMGLPPMAKDLLSVYQRRLDQNRTLASSPALFDIEKLLERADASFTEAFSLWSASGLERETRVRELLNQVPDESKVSAEKQAMLALIEDRKGNVNSAILFASKAGLLSTPRDPGFRAQIGAYAADLYRRSGKPTLAYGQLKQIEGLDTQGDALLGAIGLPKTPSSEAQLYVRTELLEKEGQWSKASEEYAQAIGAGVSNNRVLYSYAMALEKARRGESKAKVRELLERIAGSKDSDFWKNLAKEALENRTKEGT